ncbi:nuclear matrix protein [Saccharata proteae CBS 121410]|uniref:Nuclear matrix protein n=1 Tax=Saccharata proteae CBS 121410 TaxID=1314787 RepID=A0A9P4HNK9_9PEZI|nr:nuclear matrix protein [Saccharata proteae CBS 121410]
MAIFAVEPVEAITARFQALLHKAQTIRLTDTLGPPISATELLGNEGLLLNEQITNQTSHNSAAETAAKRLLHQFVASHTIQDPSFGQVWNLLDIALICAERGQCDGVLIFYLAEELLDSQSIDGCRRVFDYLESRRERLVAGDFLRKSGASKRIVVLRFCNELLRRLSRAEDAVFCGRVFIFLFQTFPLGDKSSVNSRGEFHVENATTFEETAEEKDDGDQMEVDTEARDDKPAAEINEKAPVENEVAKGADSDTEKKNLDADTLYPTFWTLQKAFSNPPRLFSGQYLAEFKQGIDLTIQKFKSVPKVVQAKSGEPRGVKRKHEENSQDQFASNYNPKYLTSRDLFKLELSDLAFQRHILVQSLILLDFLLSLTEKSKERTQKWLSTVETQNKAVQYSYTLSSEDVSYSASAWDAEWASTIKVAIANYLQELPDGKFYYRMVDTVLSRDKNWVRWKMENCPPIAQPPVGPQDFKMARVGAQKACANKRMRMTPMGSLDLSFLADSSTATGLDGLKNKDRLTTPNPEGILKDIQGDELDLEMAMTDEEKQGLQESIASKTWKALRVASKSKLSLFDKVDDGKQLQNLLQSADGGDEAGKDGQAVTEAPDSKAEGKGEDSVAEEAQEEQRAGEGSQAPAEATVA